MFCRVGRQGGKVVAHGQARLQDPKVYDDYVSKKDVTILSTDPLIAFFGYKSHLFIDRKFTLIRNHTREFSSGPSTSRVLACRSGWAISSTICTASSSRYAENQAVRTPIQVFRCRYLGWVASDQEGRKRDISRHPDFATYGK